jgi:pimeloyl-ACP methyl ester carboxylesterase
VKRFAVAAAATATASAWMFRHLTSATVRGWQPPLFGGAMAGRLYARTGGQGETAIVLLHGLVATGDIFGRDFEQLGYEGRLVVPDLLGFGRSIDEGRTRFSADDHLEALDEMLEVLGLADSPMIVGAHSMGAALAMRWVERRGSQIRRVVCWGAPVYRDEGKVDAAIAAAGLMARLFVADTKWAHLACRWNCAHRAAAGVIAAAARPSLPVWIARSASLHTWPAYRDAMTELIPSTDWRGLADSAAAHKIDVTLTYGDLDPIGDREFAGSLSGVGLERIPAANHHLPMSHGPLCTAQLGGPRFSRPLLVPSTTGGRRYHR